MEADTNNASLQTHRQTGNFGDQTAFVMFLVKFELLRIMPHVQERDFGRWFLGTAAANLSLRNTGANRS